jgi:uncharacterized protein
MAQIIDGYCMPGTERETHLPPDELLRLMDQAGIDRAVIAPEDREIAVNNEAGNARMINLANASDDRFIPACTVNPWRGPAGCRLMRDAVTRGAKMLVLSPMLQGFGPTDELADPLLVLAGELRLPVYIHTGPHSTGAPTQVVLLASRFPETRFILGHCGSTDYADDMSVVFGLAPQNVWFELGLVRPFAMSAYGQIADEGRLVFGTSAPRNDPIIEIEQFDRHWPIADHPGTYGDNLAELIAEVRP